MDLINWFTEVVIATLKHGWSITTFLVAIAALLRVRKVKQRLKKLIPMLFSDDSEVKEYVQNQARIESKLDALMAAGGVTWGVDYSNGRQGPSQTAGAAKNSSLSRVALWPVRITGLFIQRMKEIFHLLGRYQKMSKFKSRKFWMSVISAILVVANEGLDLGISSETVMTFAALVASFIFSEAYIDAKKKDDSTGSAGTHDTDHSV